MTILVAGLGNMFCSDAHELRPDAVLSLVPRFGGTVGPMMRWMLVAVTLLVLVGVGYYGVEDVRRYLRLRDM